MGMAVRREGMQPAAVKDRARRGETCTIGRRRAMTSEKWTNVERRKGRRAGRKETTNVRGEGG